ncbi:MAG TPA: CHRD domain-containing protein, partial [Thermoanaerobaculia bacterium]|nr:CHRD domain-containing protein [Thermoanaerobaculia bacterium]
MRNAFRLLLAVLLFSSTGASFAQAPDAMRLAAELSPEAVQPGAGVLSSAGYISLTLPRDTPFALFSFFVEGFNGTAYHVHRGGKGTTGPVVMELQPKFDSRGFAAGYGTGTKELIAEMRANPSAFYVDVHSTRHPDGALRGQLHITQLPAAFATAPMTGAN